MNETNELVTHLHTEHKYIMIYVQPLLLTVIHKVDLPDNRVKEFSKRWDEKSLTWHRLNIISFSDQKGFISLCSIYCYTWNEKSWKKRIFLTNWTIEIVNDDIASWTMDYWIVLCWKNFVLIVIVYGVWYEEFYKRWEEFSL